MSDPKAELNAAESRKLNAVIARLAIAGVNIDTAELRMGYMRASTPLLADIRTVGVIAVDADGVAAEIAHMLLDDLDPITLDEQIIEDVLERELADEFSLGGTTIHHTAHAIVAALRAGTTTKES